MDVHRLRFVPFPSSAINAVAFSHSSGSSAENQPIRLAIGRANGDIEIWNPLKGSWLHETTFRSGADRSVEGLAWTQDPDEVDASGYVTYGRLRLFSIGYSSTVTEWDLLTGLPLRQSTGNHSEVWCLAAQPRLSKKHNNTNEAGGTEDIDQSSQSLVAGCADGTLVLLSTANDDLSFSRFVVRAPKKKARALSLAFQNRHIVVAGYADSAIRVYDIRSGNLIRNMSLGSGPRGGPRDILCWSVHCLRNGTVVSADSTGTISFWDAKNYGQIQRIHGHEADALCLASSEDGEIVMSGGMDRRTAVYKLEKGDDRRRRWVKTVHRRFHQHDVKAMSSFENSRISLVASGGLDTYLALTPLRDFGTEYHRRLSHLPQIPALVSASKKRLIVSWWSNEVMIWRVLPRPNTDFAIPELLPAVDEERKYRTVARMGLKGEHTISSASISEDGTILAVATSAEVKVFHLQQHDQSSKDSLKINKVATPPQLATSGARLVQVSNNSKWLLRVDLRSQIQIFRISSADDEVIVVPTLATLDRKQSRREHQNNLNGSWGSYDRIITRAAFSQDDRLLAVSDVGGNIDTWVLQGTEDLLAPATEKSHKLPASSSSSADSDSDSSDDDLDEHGLVAFYGQSWASIPLSHSLPKLDSTPIILSFRPASPPEIQSPKLNGSPTVHRTRQNPLAQSNRIPKDIEGRLLVITASHELHELDVLKGRLTDWSRRNPSTRLPEVFRLQRERAMGCIWDIAHDRERVWLYGAAWVCMFDLAQDYPEPTSLMADVETNDQIAPNRKRKRPASGTAAQLQSKKHTSGAGSKIPEHELTGVVTTLRKTDSDVTEVVSLEEGPSERRRRALSNDGGKNEQDSAADSSDDDDEVELSTGLAKLRQGGAAPRIFETDNIGVVDPNQTDGDAEAQSIALRSSTQPSPFFLTNRYRAILGMVPLLNIPGEDDEEGSEDDHDKREESPTLEVALVERPEWDLDLPPRFHGRQEWEK